MSERLTREQAARLLQVTLPSSDGQVKRAYRRLAREHHPDRGGDVRIFHQLQAAFERLVEEDLSRPSVTRGRPSRTAATAPRDPSQAELDAIEVDLTVPDRAVRLHPDLVASALARAHTAAVHPLRAASRAPGARLNRAAGVMASDLTATLHIEVVADDRGHPVVAIAVTGGVRRARRALEAAALEGLWIRRRRTSSTELRSTLAPRADRRETAVATTARLVRLLDAVSWPLEQWVLTPSSSTAPRQPAGGG
ncbi:MAG: J domain-containing protein [Nitriliruptoraceae bacterium]